MRDDAATFSGPVVASSRHIERITRLIEEGADVRDLISAVQAEITLLMIAKTCRFEPDDGSSAQSAGALRLERDGTVTGHGFEPLLPDGELEIAVRRSGRRLGRFVIEPSPEVIVPLAPRIVAVLLTDHLAGAISHHRTDSAATRRPPATPPHP